MGESSVKLIPKRVRKNPAEYASLAAGIVAILALLGYHADENQRDAILFLVSSVAGIVTYFVNRNRSNGT
jgi:hypothetical protein